MKKTTTKLVVILFSLLFIQACGGIKPYKAPLMQGTVIDQAMLNDLQPGLHQTQVRQLLGPDYARNPFNPKHWEYIFASAYTDLHQDAVAHLVLKFDEEGYLIDWQLLK